MIGDAHARRALSIAIALSLLLAAAASGNGAPGRYASAGLVLKVDRAEQIVIVSCESIPNVMDAMIMPLTARDPKSLDGLQPGMTIEFTLVAEKNASYAESIHVRAYQNMENDPAAARRLSILEKMLDAHDSTKEAVATGQPVPDFSLTDQNQQQVALSQFSGKVVAITFVYVRCPLPNYCFRLSSNFARLQKRFRSALASDLVLLTVIIDPVHDSPQAVNDYARIWNADPKAWHFLSGTPAEIQQVCVRFNMNYYPDEALLVHSFRTVIIDRRGRLATNIEGNDFTAKQLGDLVQTVMAQTE
jgi:protein SCO1